jgi:hypothetical protein
MRTKNKHHEILGKWPLVLTNYAPLADTNHNTKWNLKATEDENRCCDKT